MNETRPERWKRLFGEGLAWSWTPRWKLIIWAGIGVALSVAGWTR